MIGASIGIARGEKFLPPVELMRRADIAMYDAKDSGRGSWRWFNTALDDKRLDATGIAIEMRELLEKGLFDIAYQPIVDAETRNITGLEALARWPKSSTRKLSPAEFIPVAEEHGIISDLGRYITRKACRDLASWHGINLSINVSPIQLNDNSFAASLLQILREEGFDSARLDVEFTESVLIRNPQRAKAVIAELHRHHIKVSLDDFGSGYASVGYLRSFAFDRIKIDRTLTQAVLTDMATQKVVQGTVLIARGLSADIIAEGIESEEEAQIMRLSGCQSLQGYHLGRPQPLQDLQPQLRALSEPVVGEAFAKAIAV